jgi:hypothetical protein
MSLKSNGDIFPGAISKKCSRGKTEVEIERRGEEINVTEWVEDGDTRRTVELHRSAAGFVLLNCWILAERTVDIFSIAVTERKRNSHTFALRKPEGRSPLGQTILKRILYRMSEGEADDSKVLASLTMNGAISPVSYMTSWRAQLVYFNVTFVR